MNIKGRKNSKFIYLVKDILIPLVSPSLEQMKRPQNFRKGYLLVLPTFVFHLTEVDTLLSKVLSPQVR